MPVKLHGVFVSRIIYRDIAAAVGNRTLHNLTDFPTPFQNCPPSSFLYISCIQHSPLPPLFISFLGIRESTAYITVQGCEWYGLVTHNKWKTVAVIKGPHGVSFGSCSPSINLKMHRNTTRLWKWKKKNRWSSNTSFSWTYSFPYSLWPLSPPPFWGHVAAGAASSTAVSANWQLAGWWEKVKGLYPVSGRSPCSAYTSFRRSSRCTTLSPQHQSWPIISSVNSRAPAGSAAQLRVRCKAGTC